MSNKEKCETCSKPIELSTLYKRRLKDKIHYFCSQDCKTKFELKHRISDNI